MYGIQGWYVAIQSSRIPGDSILFWHTTMLNEKLPLHGPKWLQQLQQSLSHSSQQEGKKRREAYVFFLEGHFPETAHIPSVRTYHMNISRYKEVWKIDLIQNGRVPT